MNKNIIIIVSLILIILIILILINNNFKENFVCINPNTYDNKICKNNFTEINQNYCNNNNNCYGYFSNTFNDSLGTQQVKYYKCLDNWDGEFEYNNNTIKKIIQNKNNNNSIVKTFKCNNYCPPGQGIIDDSNTCLDCPDNKYNTGDNYQCKNIANCPTNYSLINYDKKTGNITCRIDSRPGYYYDTDNLTEKPCSIGTYTDTYGNVICKTADPGYYVNKIAQITQKPADKGYYSDNKITQKSCNYGTYTDTYGNTTCSPAQIDYYVPSITLATGVSGWRLVRYLKDGSTTWHQATDNLQGTDVYGNPNDFTNSWSIPFGEYDELCIGTLDLSYWVYFNKEQISTNYNNKEKTVYKSSLYNFKHNIKWYNREDNSQGNIYEDPQISLKNHHNLNGNYFVYVEGSHSIDNSGELLSGYGGLAVWVRSIDNNNNNILNKDINNSENLENLYVNKYIEKGIIDTNYKYIIFKYNESELSKNTEFTINFTKDTECDLLLVGGGGAGGYDNSGGGGAGGLVFIKKEILNGAYLIKVGNGGIGNQPNSENGNDTSIELITNDISSIIEGENKFIAKGGGCGGFGENTNKKHGKDGGSGGGGAGEASSANAGKTNQNTYIKNSIRRGWGNDGGTGRNGDRGGGGGGGAGEIGHSTTNTYGAKGGDGLSELNGINFKTYFNIPDNIGHHISDKVYFAGGGGGGNKNNGTGTLNDGGKGGGGNGPKSATKTVAKASGDNGLANTGGGGGGSQYNNNVGKPGNGGSGIIIIRYKITEIEPEINISNINILNAYWNFNNGLIDKINNIQIEKQNTVIYPNTFYNRFLDDDGVNEFDKGLSLKNNVNNNFVITDPTLKDLVENDTWTISFWINLKSIHATYSSYLISRYDSSALNSLRGGFNIVIMALDEGSNKGLIRFERLHNPDDWFEFYSNFSFINNLNKWVHVSIICYNKGAEIYIDGKFDNKKTLPDWKKWVKTQRFTGTAYENQIGIGHVFRNNGFHSDSNYKIDCDIDELRFYNRTLLPNEIKDLANYYYIQQGTILNTTYKYIIFKYNEYTINFTEDTECDILLVGGGGAGGSDNAGGGGSGGLVFLQNIILNGSYLIKIGNGGKSNGDGYPGDNGTDSSIELITNDISSINEGENKFIAKGGGGGGGGSGGSRESGKDGGSGGGTAFESHSASRNIGKTNQNTYIKNSIRRGWGNDGGLGKKESVQGSGAGGGGAGNKGENCFNGNNGSLGGDGLSELNGIDFKTYFNIPDNIGEHIDGKVYFGGGGGGGNNNSETSDGTNNKGGKGGGGQGVYKNDTKLKEKVNGKNNTGGGGGGNAWYGRYPSNPGIGGSGVVLLRYNTKLRKKIGNKYYNENKQEFPCQNGKTTDGKTGSIFCN